MSIKNKRKSNTVNSNILNSANIEVFERLVKPTTQLILRYRLSDYNNGVNSLFNNSVSKCYTQFEYTLENGTNYNLVILCKTQEGKVFGLYTPRIAYHVERNDKLKPYFFSLDMGVTIGNKINSENDYVFTNVDDNCNGLLVNIEGYEFSLFNHGDTRGTLETTIENAQRNHNLIYNMFSSYGYQENGIVRLIFDYQEMEVYQIIDNTNCFESTIITNDNQSVFRDLIRFNEINLIQAFTLDECYINGKVNVKELHDVVIIVKTLSNHTFGIYRKGYKTYFYSVDLNEKYPLSNVKISIDVQEITVKSNEIYLRLTTDYNNKGYISINRTNLFDGHNINEVIGDVSCIHDGIINLTFGRDNVYNHNYEFKWLEVNLYEIPILKPEIITLDNKNILENLISKSGSENLTIPFNKLKPVCVFTNNDYHMFQPLSQSKFHNIKLKRNPNVVIVVKTIGNFIFAIYKNGNEAYFCSIDLNERYPLTHTMILVDCNKREVKVQSDELYLEFITSDPIGCIEVKDNNLIGEYTLDEIIGPTSNKELNRAFALDNYDFEDEDLSAIIHNDIDSMSSYGYSQLLQPSSWNYDDFEWMEIDVYEISDQK